MLAVLLSTLSVSAYDFKVDGIAYEKNDDGKSVAVCEDGYYTGNIAIPEKVTFDGATYSVSNIGGFAFEGCKGLTSVTISNSVTKIGTSAFKGCTGLTSVTIPNSVTSIGSWAFNGTPWYNNQPDGVVYIGKVAYKFKGEMASSTVINIKKGTVSISPRAFECCRWLTSITIPNSVTSIANNAFRGCTGLTSITIPNSVTRIESWAFSGCTGLTSVTIGNSVTEIFENAFEGCTGLTSVTIPNSVIEIGDYAFRGCTGLKKIYSLNPVPPVIYEGTFETYHADLFVPKGCYLKYKGAEYWKNFTFISEINVETGDIDGDGEINVGDVTALINKLLNAASFDDAVCDINGDGEVNVTDVTALINLILE